MTLRPQNWRGFYIISRQVWPNMTRRRAFLDALKVVWMTRKA